MSRRSDRKAEEAILDQVSGGRTKNLDTLALATGVSRDELSKAATRLAEKGKVDINRRIHKGR